MKTIILLEMTMEPLLVLESYAMVNALSCPIVTTIMEKTINNDWSGQIIPPTSREFSSVQSSKHFMFIEN